MANDYEIRVTSKNQSTAGFASVRRDLQSIKAEARDLKSALDFDADIDAKVNVDDSELVSVDRLIDQLDAAQATVDVEVEQPDASAAVSSIEDQMSAIDLRNMGGQIQDQMSGFLAAAGPLGAIFGTAGVTFGDDFASGFASGFNSSRTQILDAVKFGVDPHEVSAIGSEVGAAFAGGFGESLGELRQTALTLQSELSAVDGSLDLSSATRQAHALSEVFGVEIPSSINVARRLVSNDLVYNTEGAFDLMTAAAQKYQLNFEEILDVANEFAPVYSKMGFSGAEAFGMIGDMVQQGLLPNVDRAAELIEEFNIRLSESDTLRETVQGLGLDFDRMQELLASGRGHEALRLITDALLKIEDPARRNAIALEVFGAAIESASDPQRVIEILNQADALDVVAGAADRAADGVEESRSAWDRAGRDFERHGNTFGTLSEKVLGAYGALSDFFAPGVEEARRQADAAGGSFDDVGAKLEDMNGSLMLTADVYNTTRSETDDLAASTDDLTAEIEQLDAALSAFTDRFDTDRVFRSIDEDIDRLIASVTDLEGVSYDLANGFDTSTEAGRRAEEMSERLSSNLDELGQQLVNGDIDADQFVNGQNKIEAALRTAGMQMGLTGDDLDAYVNKYSRVPDEVTTKVNSDTTAASNNIANLNAQLDGINGKTSSTYVNNNITTYYRQVGSSRNPIQQNRGGPRRHGGITGAAADGGVQQDGLTLVGEEGPELVELGVGSNVRTAPDTASILGRGGGGGDTYNTFIIEGNVWAEQDLIGTISDRVRQETIS